MEKYLLEILKDSNTIIIPGLGALTATNKEKGEYMFMPYLKHDDGTLKRFIAERENCDEVEAKAKIDHFVEMINSQVNSGSSFKMPHFGTFSKDNSGDLVFDAILNDEPIQSEIETKETILEANSEAESPAQVDSTKKELEEDVVVIEETVQAEVVLEEETVEKASSIDEEHIGETLSEKNHTDIDERPEALDVESLVVQSGSTDEPETEVVQLVNEDVTTTVSTETSEYTEEQQWEDDLDLPPINAKVERPKKPIIEKAKKDKKKRSPIFYILIVLVVLLVGGATTVGVFYNQIKTALFSTEKSDTTKLAEGKQFEFTETEEETADVIDETEQEIIEPVEAPEVKEVTKLKVVEPKKTTVNGSFLLVVGSFQNEGNANRFSEKMRSEGNDSNVIGPNNGFYLVTIGSYSTEADAKSGLAEKIQRYPKVWLYKKV